MWVSAGEGDGVQTTCNLRSTIKFCDIDESESENSPAKRNPATGSRASAEVSVGFERSWVQL